VLYYPYYCVVTTCPGTNLFLFHIFLLPFTSSFPNAIPKPFHIPIMTRLFLEQPAPTALLIRLSSNGTVSPLSRIPLCVDWRGVWGGGCGGGLYVAAGAAVGGKDGFNF